MCYNDLGDNMFLKKGDIVKHFKGKSLIEKNIYVILAVNPEYTGDKEFDYDPVVIYAPLFQEGKTFIREYDDLIRPLSEEERMMYHQERRVDILTEDELNLIKTDEFIKKKREYIEEKYEKKKL